MKYVFFLFSVLVSIGTFASSMDSVRAETRAEGLYIIHEVEDQETLYSIARRYGGNVQMIIDENNIQDNRIEIGQTIHVRVISVRPQPVITEAKTVSSRKDGIHLVKQGETLYSISKEYDIKVRQLRKWNDLEDNAISPGMQLKITPNATIILEDPEAPVSANRIETPERTETTTSADTIETDPFAGFENYLVQTGETLYTIASKIGVTLDSLRIWNDLKSDYLKIGQQLVYRGDKGDARISSMTPKKRNRTEIDENGFERIYEEGVASVIQSMRTTKYLALHRTLPIGTNLEVRNLMNNQVVHVKVVGKLPDTGLNKNLLLRLSQPAYDQLGILDPKSRVEVSYYKK
ncbi:MAG: hypothetical protein Tsb0034_12100 [Ekhidna sp.]